MVSKNLKIKSKNDYVVIKKIPFEQLFEIPLRNGLFRPSHTRGSGIKMVNMKEIFANSRIGSIPMEKVPMNDDEKQKFLLQEGDLLFARQSLVYEGTGKCVLVTNSSESLTFESHIIRARLNQKISDPRFFYYYFNSRIGRQSMLSIVEQTAASGIRGNDLKSLAVIVYPIEYQRKIADILWTFDNFIEHLQNENKILDELTDIIFKSWFVDFDGITEWDHSELGKIPKGWNVKSFSEIVDVSSGKRPNEKNESKTFEYNIPCYGASKIDSYVKEALFEKPILLTGRVGTLGIIHRVYSPCFPSDNTLTLLPKDGIFFEFVYFNLKQIDFQSYNRGTSQPLLTQTDLKNIKITIPNPELLKSFSDCIKLFFNKIYQNDSQIDTLTKTRDTLLLKLMSGELRV